MSYAEKLRDPRWQKMRLEILQRDLFTCQECQSKDKELHVHHRYYIKGREPWDYPIRALVTLCCECHEKRTNINDQLMALIGKCQYGYVQSFVEILGHFDSYSLDPGLSGTDELLRFIISASLLTWGQFKSIEQIIDECRCAGGRLDAIGSAMRLLELQCKTPQTPCQTAS